MPARTFSPPIALLLLLFVACLAGCATRPAAEAPPPVLLVSIDGLRADVVGSGRMPTLDEIARAGVHADWMQPSYPTLTFPNHYTLVTGLRPDRHGIVHNTMRDPSLGGFALNNRAAVQDARWWGGEPLWVSLQRQGRAAATMFWPGSEAPVMGTYPTHWRRFDARLAPSRRVEQVLAWLDLPADARPALITLYFDQVDHAAHEHGVDAAPVRAAMATVDDALAALLEGLRARGLRDGVQLVVVSDHGMADVPSGHQVGLEALLTRAGLELADIEIVTRGQVAGIQPRPGMQARVAAALVGVHPHARCWHKSALPAHWHYGRHPRVPDIVCQADVGWEIAARPAARPRPARGAHGYAPESPEMRAVFVADGPAFRDGARMRGFQNVDVYPLLARLLRLPARPHDGDPRTFDAVLREPPP